jgi:hypothetical protein
MLFDVPSNRLCLLSHSPPSLPLIQHETAFRQSSVWLHMTEALPSEAVMEVLSATVGKKPQKLINLIGRMSSSDLVAVNEFAEEHKVCSSGS